MKLRGAFLALAVAALLAAPASASAAPSLRHLIGSRLLVAMHGTRPDAQLLQRVRRGEVAGVILFGSNIEGPRQLRALTAALRRAARAGSHPPPLVAVDQEGGAVKRLSWAPPTLSPPQIGARNSLVVAGHQGRSTARALRALGINLDLAPVCDVPRGPDSFIAAQGRAYSRSRFVVARMASAFAGGLGRGRVAATLKHFPGLGRATVSTDDGVVRILADRPA